MGAKIEARHDDADLTGVDSLGANQESFLTGSKPALLPLSRAITRGELEMYRL